jgi:hypothetical protein
VKKLIVFCLFILSLPALAVEGAEVRYIGGTQRGVTPGLIGRLDTTAEKSLIFEYASNKLDIPYASIRSFDYAKEVSHHLGVLPAIAVGLLKARQHRHLFRISYRVQETDQAAIFEVSKEMPRTLKAVLEAHGAHSTPGSASCGYSGR